MIKILSLAAMAACMPLAADPPAEPRAVDAEMNRPPTSSPCLTTVCPKLDEHGHKPRSCSYTSSMSTGFQCILACVYADSEWGSLVASKFCE